MADPRTTTDPVTGRKFTLRILTPGQMLDLLEAAGKNSINQGWVQYAMTVCSVAEIDGVPEPMPTSIKEIKALGDKLGNSGIVALGIELLGLNEGDAAPAAAQAEAVATAKN